MQWYPAFASASTVIAACRGEVPQPIFVVCVQADVNVSLTAISLLWNAADLVGKGQAGKAPAGSPAEDHVARADHDGSQSEALLRQLLTALQVCTHLDCKKLLISHDYVWRCKPQHCSLVQDV